MNSVPVIDLTDWWTGTTAARADVARRFGHACETWGFLLITGHGIDPNLLESVRAVTRDFFDLPLCERQSVAAKTGAGGRGYYRLESKSHARTRGDATAPGDLRETFFAGMEPVDGDPRTSGPGTAAYFAPNVWPARPQRMRPLWTEYMHVCTQLASELMRISAVALDLPETWFDAYTDRPISTLTAQHYPAQSRPPLPGQVRSGAHTDFGTLTLLLAEDRPGGLQVQSLAGEWIDVRPVPGAFIVNIGDMMSRWTNDRWRSTLHRVVNPPADAGSSARRLSIVYFHAPNHDALVTCIPSCTGPDNPPRHAPVFAGAHQTSKLSQTDSVGRKTAESA